MAVHASYCAICSELQEVYNIDFERFIQVREEKGGGWRR